jgi:hypothetical protein
MMHSNERTNKLAGELSSAFGCSLSEADKQISDFYFEYATSAPVRRQSLKDQALKATLTGPRPTLLA